MSVRSEQEARRVLEEYRRREREIPPDFYSLSRPANLFMWHGQKRALLWALRRAALLPLTTRRILEVGCGTGQWFSVFEDFGGVRRNLSGIDLNPDRVETCVRSFPGAEVQVGDASSLPWDNGSFDIVFQGTVFTSVLDPEVKQAISREMLRVLKPHGVILWYDFTYNNPWNPHVRGIGRSEIHRLFPGCKVELRSVTLAPPIARRLVPASWFLASLLRALRVLNTHYLGIIRREPCATPSSTL
jgi:SAM-dependent methyltransferase